MKRKSVWKDPDFYCIVVIPTTIVAFFVGLLTYIVIVKTTYKPEARVAPGDCIAYKYKGNEFEEPRLAGFRYRVLKVGKEGLLLQTGADDGYKHYSSLDSYVKINCETWKEEGPVVE